MNLRPRVEGHLLDVLQQRVHDGLELLWRQVRIHRQVGEDVRQQVVDGVRVLRVRATHMGFSTRRQQQTFKCDSSIQDWSQEASGYGLSSRSADKRSLVYRVKPRACEDAWEHYEESRMRIQHRGSDTALDPAKIGWGAGCRHAGA